VIQRLVNFVGGEIRPPVAGGREIRLVVVDVEGDGFQLEPRAPVMQHSAEAPGAYTAEQRLARGCATATNRLRRRRTSCIRHQLATWVGAAGRLAVNLVGGILPFARTCDANWDLLKSVVRILSSGRAPK